MKRALVLAIAWAVLAALPATAHAAGWKGAVVAKDSKRRAVVTASSRGVVVTVRTGKAYGRLRVGQLVSGRVNALPDGTFAAKSVRVLGRAKRARVRAVVVARQQARGRMIVSAGKSVFAIGLRGATRTTAADDEEELEAGDKVVVDGELDGDGVEADAEDVEEVGHSSRLELEGIFVAYRDGAIELAVVHRGLIRVRVPDEVARPKFAAGDEIVLVVEVDAHGTFTLVTGENEDGKEHGDSGDGIDIDAEKGEFTVVGTLAELSRTRVAVRIEGASGLVRCLVPEGIEVPGLSVGDRVKMLCRFRDGRIFFARLQSMPAGDRARGKDGALVKGALVTVSKAEVAVRVEHAEDEEHEGKIVRCSAGENFDPAAFAVGERVKLKCRARDGRLVLSELHSGYAYAVEEKTAVAVKGVLVELSTSTAAVRVDGRPQPFRCAIAAGTELQAGLAVGKLVKLECRARDGRPLTVHGLWLKEETTDTAKGEFTVNGVISTLSSTSISVSVEGRTEPARCLVPPTANVSGFAVGDVVELHCHVSGGAWVLAALKSARAVIGEDGSASFTVQGVLSEKSSSFIGVTVERHPDAVRCSVPAGADLAAFAVGDVVEMRCHFHGGFVLASLKSSSASLVLEQG